MSKKLDRYEFIWKAIQKHGYKYDYRKVEYVNAKAKVCIICSEHGEFLQTPDNHLRRKQSCPKCANNGVLLTIEEFIEKAKLIHGDKYDYSKVDYVNNRTKICIVCPEHGEFWQTPDGHLQNHGCGKCASNGVLLTTEEFIAKSIQIHANKYDYSKVKYVNSRIKVCIICPKHGEFWQMPVNHLIGQGCPICKESKLEMKVSSILDTLNITCFRQHSFPFLKNGKGKQSLDFYLPDYNIAIECQGIQHFEPVDFGGKGKKWAQKFFHKMIERDNKKLKLCNENNVKMLYINHFDSDEEINLKIKNIKNDENR